MLDLHHLRGDEIIVARGVSKIFPGGHHALHELSCGIATGERIALVGANGAGKSTALRVLNLSYRPSSGTVFWKGDDTAAMSAEALRQVRSRIGTVPQKYDLIPQLTVRANVLTGRLGRYQLFESFWSMLSQRDQAEVERALSLVGIHHLIEERCDRLSGGEQQRVAIARALFQNPEVLFADEPLAAVDPAGATKLMELLVNACEASRCALIMTSHQLHLLKDYFPRVIGLRQGRVFFDVSSDELTPRMMSSLYGTEGGLRQSSSSVRGASLRNRPLRIGISSMGCEYVASDLLPEIARRHPDASLSVSTNDDATLASQLAACELDVAFVLKGQATDKIALIPVREEKVVLVSAEATNGVLLAPEELLDYTLLWPDPTHPVAERVSSRLEDRRFGAGVPSASIELGSIVSVKAAVIRGLGCAFLPLALVEAELEDGILHELRVAGLDVSYPVYAMRRQSDDSPELIDSVVEMAAHGSREPIKAVRTWYGG